jgi:hypothetical protein
LLAGVVVLTAVGSAAEKTYQVFINNQQIDGYRGEDGDIYVSLQKVAKIMGTQVAVEGDRAVVDLGAPAAAAQAKGGLRGAIEYFYLGGQFRKIPDVGARVWVIDQATVDAAGLTTVLKDYNAGPGRTFCWVIGEKDGMLLLGPQQQQLYKVAISGGTAAGANGNYRIDNLAPGPYWVFIRSNHVTDRGSKDGRPQIAISQTTIDPGQSAGVSSLFSISGG